MATKFITPSWRMPKNINQSKASNYSLNFDGGEYITIGSSPELDNIPLNPYSFSFWFKSTTASRVISEKRAANTFLNAQYTIHLEGGYVAWYGGQGSSNNGRPATYTSTTLNDNQWHHVVCVAESTTLNKIYIDGQLDATSTNNKINSAAVAGTFRIGSNYVGSYRYIGNLCQYCIFDYALPTGSISALYHGGIPSNPLAITKPPIAFYDLGQGSAYAEGSAGIVEPNLAQATGSTVFDIPSKSVGTAKKYISTNINNLSDIDVTDKITVSTWVNFDDATVNAYNPIINKGQILNSSNLGFAIARTRTPSGKIYASIKNALGTSVTAYSDASTVSSGKWANIVMRYDGAHVKIYVDGKLYESAAQTGNILDSSPTEPVVIGSDYYYVSGLGNNLVGKVSNVQIWNTDLSDGGVADGQIATGDILTLYNNGTPLQSNIPQSGSLKAWYKLGLNTSEYSSKSTNWNVQNSFKPIEYKKALEVGVGSVAKINLGNGFWTPYRNPSEPLVVSTISFWAKIKVDISGNVYAGLTEIMGNNSGGIRLNQNDLFFIFGSTYVRWDVPALNNDAFHHIALVIPDATDKNTAKLYINGEDQESSKFTSGGTPQSPTYPMEFCNFGFGINGRCNSLISNIQIFTAALDNTGEQSITSLYNEGQPKDVTGWNNLIGWWKVSDSTWDGSKWDVPATVGSDAVTSTSGTGQFSSTSLKTVDVNANIGLSSGMDTTNLVPSNLIKSIPYSGYSMNFDGSSDLYFALGTNITVGSGGYTTYSWSVWVKPTGTSDITIFGDNGLGDDGTLFLDYASSKFTVKMEQSGTELESSTGAVVTDVWTHILVIIDPSGSGTKKMYINGVDDTVNGTGQGPNGTIKNLSTGPAGGLYYNEFNGNISNWAFFNRILTEDEILRIYNGGSPGDLTNLSPTHWWSLGADSYFNGSNWICPDLIGTNNLTGENSGGGELSGDGPDSLANGTSTNLDLASDLIGEAPGSTGNAISINMNSLARTGSTP